ncbi:3-dehydroquinate synthase [Sellimonas sp.]|uniref:3-dehydroquinate synthase n=1 Tax=Sellimonas sp. TaxID=2021466 RepID=UPI000B38E827|nr:3-dehydroquinate synthase [Sellimonas sp.]OUP02929.1 3-dehydroquinate synthase [Drancourtella sp. An210]OUP65047.1 3-dehydroquinate synthase [Drancourtella sp. An177]
MKLNVNLGEKSYEIFIERGVLRRAADLIAEVFHGKKIMIISDDRVYGYYGEVLKEQLQTKWECYEAVVPHGEASKSMAILPEIYGKLLQAKLSRSDLIVALGGGVVGDMAGFAAATYLRGIPFIQIPTSLLAQVDSSVGGKVAVDLKEGKNLVGAFYQPKLVLIDPDVLSTLPKRYINDGMGEVIKYGCIKDRGLFDILKKARSFEGLGEELTGVIARCVDIKRQIVEEDQYDTGERMLLNFGHTLGHAVEQKFAYERESHGEAVAVGMYQITRIAEEKGMTEEGTAEELREVLKSYGLPISAGVKMKELKAAMMLDKKNLNDRLRIILIKKMGESFIFPTDVTFFEDDITV